MSYHVAAVPYDPDWVRRFEDESALLRQVLAPWLVDGIHHVGSTSVPGLPAKPTIDMIAGVRDLNEAWEAFAPLSAIGYRYLEHRPEAHAFHKPGDAAGWWDETHHLHITEAGSDIWRERLAFRDALRADPLLLQEYAQWKSENTNPVRARNSYIAGKRAFVQRVLAAQGIELRPDEQRLSEAARARRAALAVEDPL